VSLLNGNSRILLKLPAGVNSEVPKKNESCCLCWQIETVFGILLLLHRWVVTVEAMAWANVLLCSAGKFSSYSQVHGFHSQTKVEVRTSAHWSNLSIYVILWFTTSVSRCWYWRAKISDEVKVDGCDGPTSESEWGICVSLLVLRKVWWWWS